MADKKQDVVEDEVKPKAHAPSAEDYLELAAQSLEQRKGTHAPKHYHLLAAEIRRLAERIE